MPNVCLNIEKMGQVDYCTAILQKKNSTKINT